MTIRERFRSIGQAITTGKLPTETVIKEVKNKSVGGGFLEFGNNSLTGDTTVSTKLLAANVGWVYRNNDVIAKEVANIEFELYRVNVRAGEIVYDPVVTHPLLDALDRFNEFTSASDGFYITQSHRKLTGDAFWFVDGSGTNINGIYLLQPDKVTINLGKVAGNNKVIESYTYKDVIKGEPIEVTYAPEDIIHFKIPNPANYYRGKSAVEAAAEAIDTDSMAIEANRKLFERGLIANFMLTTDKSLTPEQLKQLHSEFRNTYGGVANAYKVPILGGGIKSENLQMSNRDAQYLEQQAWLRDKITAIFGNNKAVLGVTDDVNRANAEATISQWRQTTVRSEMKEITDTLNEFFVPRFGTNLVLGFEDLVKEDESAKTELLVKQKNADIISINEAREELGLDPIDGGDEHSFQRTERQMNANPPALKYVELKKLLRKRGIYNIQAKQLEEIKNKEAIKLIAKSVVGKKPKKKEAAPVESLDRNGRYIKKQLAIADSNRDKFLDAVQSFMNKVVDKAVANIPAEIRDMQNKQLLNKDELVTEAVFDLTPYLIDVAKQAGGEALALINEPAASLIVDPTADIQKQVRGFMKSSITTAEDKMVSIITDGVKNGAGVQKISQSIRKEMPNFTKVQSDRIARTELLRSSNLTALEQWKNSGLVSGKEWDARFDADAICKQYDGDVIKLDGDFYQTKEFANGNPPIHPNCRCVLLPVLFDDKRVNLWNDERGNIQFSADEITGYHAKDETGVGRNTNIFGDAFYIARDAKTAQEFGDNVVKATVPIKEAQILRIASQAQFDKFVKEAIKWSNANNLPIDTNVALPSYAISLGYKAIEGTPSFDPLAGIGIVDPKLKKIAISLFEKAVEEYNYKAQVSVEQENNKKLLKKLKEQDKYIKDLEGYLDED